MSPEESKLQRVKALVQEWLDQQGHERCWYYPELFNRIAHELGLTSTKAPSLPPQAEFENGCRQYTDEQYRIENAKLQAEIDRMREIQDINWIEDY